MGMAPMPARPWLPIQHEDSTTMTTNPNRLIYQFKVTLLEIEPAIWRRLQVPATYSFWDLYVAFQDAMGWLDDHLHEFRMRRPPKRKMIEIGIPADEASDTVVMPGWKIGSLVIPEIHNSMIFMANNECPYKSSWIL
jgi:hypothetical protein